MGSMQWSAWRDLESRSPGLNPSSATRELHDLGNHPVAPGFLLGRTDLSLELLCGYSRGVKGNKQKTTSITHKGDLGASFDLYASVSSGYAVIITAAPISWAVRG